MTLDELAQNVSDRQTFDAFLDAFVAECRREGADWTNPDLYGFLEAMAAWSRDSAGYYANVRGGRHPTTPWQAVADMLMAARCYE